MTFTCVDAFALVDGPIGRGWARRTAVPPATEDDVLAGLRDHLWSTFVRGATRSARPSCPHPDTCPAVTARAGEPCQIAGFSLPDRPIDEPAAFVKRILKTNALRQRDAGLRHRDRFGGAPASAPDERPSLQARRIERQFARLAGAGSPDRLDVVADSGDDAGALAPDAEFWAEMRAGLERLRRRIARGEPLEDVLPGVDPKRLELKFKVIEQAIKLGELAVNLEDNEAFRRADEYYAYELTDDMQRRNRARTRIKRDRPDVITITNLLRG